MREHNCCKDAMAPSQARKNRRARRAANRSAHKHNAKQKIRPDTASFEELLHNARESAGAGNFEDSAALYERVCALKDPGPEICEEVASVHMQVGRLSEAEKMFRTAIRIEPNSGFEKFACLAQLLGNTEEALELTRRGIEIIHAEGMSLNLDTEQEQVAELRKYEASAHCAVAEICLGIIEESNDPQVAVRLDVEVEKAVMSAIALSEEGSESEVEAMLSLANLRLSQGRREDAIESMKRVLLRMSPGLEMLETGDHADTTIAQALSRLPSLEYRIAVGKQLIEVDMWRAAIITLNSVMWECDFNVEVWYLLAVAYWKLGEFREARNVLQNTRAVRRSPDGYDGELEEDMIEKLEQQLVGRAEQGESQQDAMRD